MKSQSHKYVEAMKKDIATEKLLQGDPARCWIGCVAGTYDFKIMAEKMGWPLPLVRIGERIFEGMNKEDGQNFAVNILAAPKPGADLSLVHWKFLHWMVGDVLEKHGSENAKKANQLNLQNLKDLSEGKHVSVKRKIEARADAAAAAAAYAADAAAYAAADAADAAAAAAAYAADAAAYAAAYAAAAAAAYAAAAAAAYAADAAAYAAAAAAYAAAYKKLGEKLLEFMGEPVGDAK